MRKLLTREQLKNAKVRCVCFSSQDFLETILNGSPEKVLECILNNYSDDYTGICIDYIKHIAIVNDKIHYITSEYISSTSHIYNYAVPINQFINMDI